MDATMLRQYLCILPFDSYGTDYGTDAAASTSSATAVVQSGRLAHAHNTHVQAHIKSLYLDNDLTTWRQDIDPVLET